jgi:hypothetical protein
MARSGNVREALPVLSAVAKDELAMVHDCADAAFVALGSGDMEGYRHVCAIGLSRFVAGAEGVAALNLAEMLLAAPQDALIIEVAGDLVGRVEQARDFSRERGVGLRAWLDFRKGHVAEAAAFWPRAASLASPTSPISARVSKSEYIGALIGFRSALSLALLGQAEEARQAYAEGLKGLGPAPSADHPRDLGEGYARWYLADAHRREAEAALKAKGITIPDIPPPAK